MTKSGIGSLKESSLHASLKEWLRQPGDAVEAAVDGYLIDLVHGDTLIEIQTRNFSMIKPKLEHLLQSHRIRLVHPIPVVKWIVREASGAAPAASRRRSPRRGRPEDIFWELVRIPHLVPHPNLTIEILLIHEEEIRRADGRGSWRRMGWSIFDRKLIEVQSSLVLRGAQDYRHFLPAGLPAEFSSRELATIAGLPEHLTHKMVYCLHKMELLTRVGKRSRSFIYSASQVY